MTREERAAEIITDDALKRPSGLRETFNEFIAAHATTWELVFGLLAIVYVGLDLIFDNADAATVNTVQTVEIVLTVLFAAEFFLRLWAAPDRSGHLTRHWLDAFALFPPIRGMRALGLSG